MYLIIGASSFIGKHLFAYCKEKNINVLGTYYSHAQDPEWVKFDLCKDNLEELCHKNLNAEIPKGMIICGANASIDGCKKNESVSNQLNVEHTKRLLEQADGMGIKSVFLSSEAVFNGEKGMYTEEDLPDPITLYGKQKLQIEQYMFQNLKEYLVFRISRAVGSHYEERDIFQEFYHKILKKDEIVCLKNQSFCITEIGDIVQGILNALEWNISGLYHLSSFNYISRYKLACLYAKKVFGGYDRIVEKEYEELPFLDRRHVYAGLNGEKLASLLKINYIDTEEILNRYVKTLERR